MTRSIRTTSRALVCAVALLSLPAFASAQVIFRQVFAPGDVMTFNQTMGSQTNMTASTGGQVMQQMQQTQSQVRSGTMTVQEVSPDGKVTKATFVFDQNNMNVMDAGPMGKQSNPSSIAGKTITVTQKGSPKELDFSGQVNQQGAIEITQLFRNDGSMMPEKPVSVGDTWEVDPDQLKQLLPPGSDGTVTGNGKLLGVRMLDGREVAEVEMNLTMNAGMPGMKMDMKMNGKGLIDTQTSRAIDVNLTGPMTAGGQQQGPNGQPMVLDVKGNMNLVARSAIKGSPVANNNAPVNGPGPVNGPVTPPGPFNGPVANNNNPVNNNAQNPFDLPNTPAEPTGTFTDGNLTLNLPPNGQPTIKLGDKTFPIVESTFDGQSMQGAFNAGGQQFPFKATFEGDNATFESGSRKSTLKRAGGPRNPLED